MGDGFQFLDIILFAAIAAFLILRLRSILGRRSGHQGRRDLDPFRRGRKRDAEGKGEETAEEKVIHLPNERKGRRETAAETGGSDDPLSAGLTQIKLSDRNFDEQGFVTGARAAFEMIIVSFAQGDSKTLRPLLADEVFRDFSGAIEEREKRGETLESTLVGISSAEIIEAEMQGKVAFVTVKFVSEQVNVTRDQENRIVDGDPSAVTKVTDIWTFARNTRSRDPNWSLVATRSPN
jgi:predicted lipid-binding transport protein (Tim44 family)